MKRIDDKDEQPSASVAADCASGLSLMDDVRLQAPTVQLLTLGVRDVMIDADIGILPSEIGVPQPLRLSVTLHIERAPPIHIEDTIDYMTIVAVARGLGKERIGLIETFAHRLAEFCLEDAHVKIADVRVEKLKALPSGVAYARVVLSKPANLPPALLLEEHGL